MDTDQLTPELAEDAPRHSMQRLVRHLDLFSGIGGFALAAQMVGGIKTVGFCEINPYAQKVLTKNFPGIPIYDDVKTLNPNDYGRIDLITGGYPCQPFSSAGQRKGANDDRHLWPAMRRIIEESRPRWVLSENVVGHITLGLDQVLAEMESIGYSATATVIPACAVDALHRRDRIWIVAHTAGVHGDQYVCKRQDDQWSGASPDWSALRSDACDDLRWSTEPRVRRVADGIPSRVDRNHGLGNAIVPQVAAEILRAMMAVDCMSSDPFQE
jgi:DNA (cytosine-5)-methyltransferase 1